MALVKRKKTQAINTKQLKRGSISWAVEYIDKFLYKLIGRTLFSEISTCYPINRTLKYILSSEAFKTADVVHLHNLHYNYFDLKALQEIAAEKPMLWTLHDLWACTGGDVWDFSGQDHIVVAGVPKSKLTKHIFPLHHPIIDFTERFFECKKAVYAALKDKITFVPVSSWSADMLNQSGLLHPENKVQVVWNGVDSSFFNYAPRTLDDLPLSVLFFNSSNPIKGADLVKQALNALSGRFKLIVVGKQDFEYEGEIEVHTPVQSPDFVRSLYQKADILLVPSRAESFGLLAVEGAMCGCCVLGSDVGGLGEVLSQIKGFTFEAENAASLADKLENLLAQEKAAIHQCGKESAELAATHFSIDKMRENYQSLYKEIIARYAH